MNGMARRSCMWARMWALVWVLMAASLLPLPAAAQEQPEQIVQEAATAARRARLTSAWMTFGAGAVEVTAGGAFLGTLQPGAVHDVLPAILFASGGIELALSLPLFLQQTRIEQQADGPWEKTPDNLRDALGAERAERAASLVFGALSLAAAAGGEAFVVAYPGLADDARTAFATAIGVVGALDVALLVRAVLTHPVRDALTPRAHAALGPGTVGLAGTF